MSDKPQPPAKGKAPKTEKTRTGYEVPIPKRDEFFRNLAKTVQPNRETDS
jgi:hypothetical protein